MMQVSFSSTDLLDSRMSFELKFFFSRIPKKYTPQKALIFTRNASMVIFLEVGFKSPISIANDKVSTL